MQRRDLILGAAALTVLAACDRQPAKTGAPPAPATPAPPDPATVIRPLYDRYMTQGATFPAFQEQAPWSADLWAKLDAMRQRSEAANEPILDFDPLIGAQDYQLSNLTVTTEAMAAGSHAVVRAHFTNLSETQEIVYDLIWEAGAWRVDNIRGADWDLRQIAAQTAGQ